MPMSERMPSTMNSFLLVEISQNSVVGQQRLQISELQFDYFSTPSSFLYWKIRIYTQVSCCSEFLSNAMLWIKEVEMIASVDEFKSSRSISGKIFPNSEMLDARIASALPIQNEGQSGGTEGSERGSVSSRKTNRLHDLRLLSSHWRSWYRSWLCGSILYHSPQRQCSGLRYEMGWNSIIHDQDPVGCSGKSVQIKNTRVWEAQNRVGIVWHGNSSEDIDAQLWEVEDDGEKEHRSESSITKFRRQRRGNWDRSNGYESQAILVALKEEKEFAISGKQKGKPTPKAAPPSEPPRGRSQLWEVQPTGRAKISWTVLAPNYLVTIGILPNVSVVSPKRDVNSAQSARFRTGRLRNNRIESRKRMVTKMQWL